MNNRLAYALIAVLLIAVVVKYAFLNGSDVDAAAAPHDTVASAERRLDLARKAAATLPGETETYQKAAAELGKRESALLQAATEQQADVALLDLVQNTGRANQIEIRGSQEFRNKPLTPDYAEISVTVSFTCAIEQLVNFLTAIGNQPQTISTSEIQISGGTDKKKNVQVRLVVSAAVPRKLIPEKKGVGAF